MKLKNVTGTATIILLVLGVVIAVPASATRKVAGDDITCWVKDALHHDEHVAGAKITVNTEKGITTLSGTVDNLAARNFADQEAKKIRGVLGVINEIKVAPAWRSDANICNAVQRRILNSALIETKELGVTSQDGWVTLSGTVSCYAEKNEAELLASEVVGVKGVTNELLVVWNNNRSDQEIKDDVVATLGRNVYLSDLPITVVVKEGVVTLSGSVGNRYEKDLASTQVRWVANVKDVTNELHVEWRENRGAWEQPPRPTGEALQKAVETELEEDSRINAGNITVKVSAGEVKLDGSVANFYQRRIAGQDAKDVVGVDWVMNNLYAKGGENRREDWVVRNDIEFNLKTDALLESYDIGVQVKDGVVTLLGDVHSKYEKVHAADIVSRILGVKEVINRIIVTKTPA